MATRHLMRPWRLCASCRHLTTSNEPGAPPILLKLRSDLKAALKAKDANRLNVLRALLADTTNLAKSNKPVQTDLQVLSLIRKRATAGKSAASEFGQAKRDDLKAKEEAQVHVLEEYAGSIETIPEAEIQLAVQRTVESLKRDGGRLDLGTVLKRVLGKDGLLEGRPVETGEVARLVKSSLAS